MVFIPLLKYYSPIANKNALGYFASRTKKPGLDSFVFGVSDFSTLSMSSAASLGSLIDANSY